MKTVKQASIDIIQEYDLDVNFRQDNFDAGMEDGLIEGFVRGVEWAQRWISFNDDSPEQADYVLVRNAANIKSVVFDKNNPANKRIDKDNFAIDGVCYSDWRPINFK
jgi:hypothetical protein